jgi:hypothetical protein
MNTSLKNFLRQALKARSAAADSHDKRQWLLVAEMWDLIVREEKRGLEIAPEGELSSLGNPLQK